MKNEGRAVDFNPPADLIARTSGRIDALYFSDGQTIARDEVLALLYNVADYDHVKQVNDFLNTCIRQPAHEVVQQDWLRTDYQMGELQSTFTEFRRACMDYAHYLSLDNIGKKQSLLRAQIAKNKEYYDKQIKQQATQGKELHYGEVSLSRDSALFARGVISQEEYEQAIRSHLQRESSNESFDASLTNTELSILQKEQQLIELDIQKQDEIAQYERTYSNNFLQPFRALFDK